ncbi:MAG: hypothetical protein FVQ78_10650 [Solirubrobacterales bacterium]|nr:hypothetical protein [Solirubrobacterales bacterium]
MNRIKHARPSPALVISVLALLVALGGTSYAASKVGGSDLKSIKVRTANTTMQPGAETSLKRKCKKGEQYISGGFDTTPTDAPGQPINISSATSSTNAKNKANGFFFRGTNTGAQASPVIVTALCLKK